MFLRVLGLLWLATPCWAEAAETAQRVLDLTWHWSGMLALGVFALAYVSAVCEELLQLNKSKPMMLAASIIWALIAAVYAAGGLSEEAGQAFRAYLEVFAELFLFIVVSMAYLNALENRGVFEALRCWLLSQGFGYRKLFWITGILAFFISSVCNNLTTALLMGSVIMAMGIKNQKFLTLACINVVVATNAGGSFSPFGDITTLLVWQKGIMPFSEFFRLFLPALVTFALPAAMMQFFVPQGQPLAAGKPPRMKRGAWTMIGFFFLTILTAVGFEDYLGLPPTAGMLAGLTYLKFLAYYLQKTDRVKVKPDFAHVYKLFNVEQPRPRKSQRFDIFKSVAALEWDTLLFFYGVLLSLGGLSFIGYLGVASHWLYADVDPTLANVLVGLFSAFIDNGSIMFAVLSMHPDISHGQWLLVTLTIGVGGSLLSIGSAAGVGLMGQARGVYTFSAHLRWTPVIFLGFIGGVATHILLNGRYF